MATRGPMAPVSGRAMLLVTLFLVVAMLALAYFAGPFGRTPRLRQEPIRHWAVERSPPRS